MGVVWAGGDVRFGVCADEVAGLSERSEQVRQGSEVIFLAVYCLTHRVRIWKLTNQMRSLTLPWIQKNINTKTIHSYDVTQFLCINF